MKVYKIYIIALGLLVNIQALGQPSVAQFTEKEYDFGDINEGVQAQHQFIFKNTGTKPIKLTSVHASCGCTTPEWSAEPIPPGKTGFVKAIYNSTGRPGGFTKTITVMVDDSQEPITLTIRGNVIPKLNDIYVKDTIGGLGFENLFIPVNNLASNDTKNFTIKFKNITQKETIDIIYNKTEHSPAFVPTFDRFSLKPGDIGTLTIQAIGEKWKEAGLEHSKIFNQKIVFYTNEKNFNKKEIVLNGTFVRIFTEKELAEQPKIEFEKLEFDAGNIIQGEKVNYAFKFKNAGGGILKIESAKPSCGCTASAPRKSEIEPGETSQIEMTFDSAGRSGPQSKTITVTSNDPINPTIVLKFKCNVQTNPFSGGFQK